MFLSFISAETAYRKRQSIGLGVAGVLKMTPPSRTCLYESKGEGGGG